MTEVDFPHYVEDFVRLTGEFLQGFELSLALEAQFPDTQSRSYNVEASDGPVGITVHRTSGSLGQEIGEYRVRVLAHVIPEFTKLARDIQSSVNSLASVAALVDGATGVTCQCLIPEHEYYTTAGILALAIAHGRRSLLLSQAKMMTGKSDNTVEQLSDWSDLDFEIAHYDHAHLGRGTRHQRGWRMVFLGGASLSLDAVHNNPYWGGGLLVLLAVPKATVSEIDPELDAEALNMWGNLVGRTPTFGAWCERDDQFVFVQFFPNFMKPLPNLTDLIIRWAWVRSYEIQTFADFRRHLADEAAEDQPEQPSSSA
jgi:hypothetical protein